MSPEYLFQPPMTSTRKDSIAVKYLNSQPRELAAGPADNSGMLSVHSIWPTLQGEGPFAGTPAIFIRLAGCNLQCPLCDTDYTSGRKNMTVEQIAESVDRMNATDRKLIVITGGEPFRQHLHSLLRRLMLDDPSRQIQIETNGVLPHRLDVGCPDYWNALTVVCSPKTTRIHDDNVRIIKHYKYVLEAGRIDPTDGLPLSSLGYEMRVFRPTSGSIVYVQPVDVQDELQNRRHLEAALESCVRFNYRLCLQIHKIVGLP